MKNLAAQNHKTILKKLLSLLCILGFLVCSDVFAQPINSMNVYFIGNSQTDDVNFLGLKAMALERNKLHAYGRQRIPGAPLSWLWSQKDQGIGIQPYGPPANAFKHYAWDAISLQPFDRTIEGDAGDLAMSLNFINLAKTKSPEVQAYIFQRYPRTNHNIPPNSSSLTAEEWNRRFIGANGLANERRAYFENLALALRQANPTNKKILMVPVGEVMRVLNNKIIAGMMPGYSSIWEFYADDKHMNNLGQFLMGTTYYATLYQENPTGLAVSSRYGFIDPAIARLVQQTAWEVLTSYKDPQQKNWSGVAAAESPVNSVSLNKNALSLAVNQSYTLQPTVLPYWATNQKVGWTSSNPNIAVVSATGVVKGIAPGSTTITVKTDNGGKTAESLVSVQKAAISVTSVKLSRSAISIRHGALARLFAVKAPDNATKGVLWKSSNPTVATVDVNGKITTVGAGTANISAASISNPAIKDTCALTVSPNQAPVAVLTAVPVEGRSPLKVKFSGATSYDNDATDIIRGYDWDFGDSSSPDNSSAPLHTYAARGTYVARLRVMDNAGLKSAWVTKTITVH